MGSNMAEAHPVGFQWVMEAKQRGARVIHIDPRYTRTSALADTYVQLRTGSDVAFLGGVVNHILSNELDFREYLLPYTNAATIVSEDFQDTEDLDGLFSGYNPTKAVYDPASWHYEGMEPHPGDQAGAEQSRDMASGMQHESGGPALQHGDPPRDETLQHPRCVYQILKRHFARYTPEVVEEVCGVPREQFLEVADAWAAASGRDRTAAVVYAVGWTQHTVGVQFIRTAAIIQLLLGNMGRPGGGIMAMRGHASIQGSTDVPTLFNLLPGYLAMPTAAKCSSLDTWISSLRGENQKGFWRNADAYAISLLKEYFGDNATSENDYCYDHLPRLTGDHGTYRTMMDMIDGLVKGYFLLGQNPAIGSVHGRLQRLAMANLDWLVVRDLAMIESATFWKDSPEVDSGEIVPAECRTEVFFFPAASHVEKDGTFTNTQRLLQWREKAIEPSGDQRSELWFFYHLGRLIRDRLAGSTDPRDRPVQDLNWAYETSGGPGWRPSRGRVGAQGDQRLRPGRAARRLHRPQGRRLDRVRLLDLLGGVREGRQPAGPAQAPRPAGRRLPGVGLGLADGPAGALQPRLRRPGRQALVRAQEVRLVGRGPGPVGRPGRARLRGDQAAVVPAAGGRGRSGGAARGRPVHHAGRRQGLAVRAERAAGRADADPLRAARVAVRATRSTASRATRPARSTAATTTRRTRRRRKRTARSSRTCCSPRG